ncbi:class I histocompatibility antigen, Gogo-B*0102 alpha chain-like [Grammomys surdaster]|uniref:class I histocompatibility antigen, Gogo-B*0102 alpha chain-like n=1 Tax=Grammomys surdaster TaxID=491861 RepID=UPI00109F30C2|nr:class I histocompatibility antigen, Gogo-B*0102 alpha chain-like [Grammomys surdaster]
MGAPVLCANLLLLSAFLPLIQTKNQSFAGSHSLRYLVTTTTTRPGLRNSHVLIVGYVDYMQFTRFDSDGATQRIQARGPWMKQMGPAYLEMERKAHERYSHTSRENLRFAIQVYNQSDNVFHTFQCFLGCDMGPDRHLLHMQYEHAFDGRDYIRLNSDLRTWTVADKTAQITQRQWEADNVAEHFSNFFKAYCVQWLPRHLETGKETLLRSDPPKAHVTHQPRPEGDVTLRCWALGFYPPDIILTWQRNEEDLTQDMDLVETRPSGDGTFQKWASVVVPSGEEQKYTCRVEHEGLPKPLTLRWEPPPRPVVGITVGVVLLGVVIIGALMAFVTMKKKNAGREGIVSEGFQ